MFKKSNVNSQMTLEFFVKKILIGCICACFASVMNAEAFNETSHKYITKTVFESIIVSKSDNLSGKDSCELPNDLSEGGTEEDICELPDDLSEEGTEKDICEFFNFLKNLQFYKELIIEYSNQPDIDENQGVYKYHFYNLIIEANFMNEKESALTKCKNHFNKAIEFYKDGNKTEACQELGRSIHFMEDMNTPVHTVYDQPTDAIFKLALHIDFEKECDNVCEECKLKVVPEELDYYQVNSLDTIANSAATLSADNFYYLENGKIDKKTIAKNAVSNAQKKVLGMVYKFFSEVSNR